MGDDQLRISGLRSHRTSRLIQLRALPCNLMCHRRVCLRLAGSPQWHRNAEHDTMRQTAVEPRHAVWRRLTSAPSPLCRPDMLLAGPIDSDSGSGASLAPGPSPC